MFIQSRIQSNKPLANLSTIRIGGVARYFIAIKTIEEMEELSLFLDKEGLPSWIVGRGSNSLFDDRGFDGLLIHNQISFVDQAEEILYVGAGTPLSPLSVRLARQGWGGIEFAAGIPGSVGGALYMNAGTAGSTMADALLSVVLVTPHGSLLELRKEELSFGYRFSSLQRLPHTIVAARFQLHRSPSALEQQNLLLAGKRRSQPYGQKSIGCIFRNPPGAHAGALIAQCGLKGVARGGALVSPLHANFIVNQGGATSKDVVELAEWVAAQVKEKSGWELQKEICCVPYRRESSVSS